MLLPITAQSFYHRPAKRARPSSGERAPLTPTEPPARPAPLSRRMPISPVEYTQYTILLIPFAIAGYTYDMPAAPSAQYAAPPPFQETSTERVTAKLSPNSAPEPARPHPIRIDDSEIGITRPRCGRAPLSYTGTPGRGISRSFGAPGSFFSPISPVDSRQAGYFLIA